MEITDGNLQTLAGYLEKTMAPEPDIRKPGTFFFFLFFFLVGLHPCDAV